MEYISGSSLLGIFFLSIAQTRTYVFYSFEKPKQEEKTLGRILISGFRAHSFLSISRRPISRLYANEEAVGKWPLICAPTAHLAHSSRQREVLVPTNNKNTWIHEWTDRPTDKQTAWPTNQPTDQEEKRTTSGMKKRKKPRHFFSLAVNQQHDANAQSRQKAWINIYH